METVRLRLVFDRLLTKSINKLGFKRCWILVKPEHKTISDLSSYLLHSFSLQNDCPSGLILSMEGFVLPPFESTSILKDKDIIRVQKNGGVSSEIVEVGDEANSLEVIEIVETQPVTPGMNLLANEEFEEESGGYQSEEEEEQAEEEVQLENAPEVSVISKKRKASKELKSLKKKKKKSASAEKHAVVVEDVANNVGGEQNGTSSTARVDKRSENNKALANTKRLSQPQENGNGNIHTTPIPSGSKKLPSRSARRKKAKRRWVREKLKAERAELHRRQLLKKSYEQSSEEDSEGVSQESAEKGNLEVSKEIQERDNGKLQEDHTQSDQDDVGDEVVPIVIRPGHIRFAPLRKVGADQAVHHNQIPLETFQWNGITSKKKGQKWGKEKVTSYRRNDYKNVNQECSKALKNEARPVFDCINFEKLEFYTSLPKEGDMIAFRVLELSSSWTPELSSYQVGKISRYDMQSNRVRLAPVPGYPMIPESNASDMLSASPCARDGSLWREFSSLIEVRLVTRGNLNSVKPVAGGVDEVCVRDQDSRTSFRANNGNEGDASALENGEVNPWEEINQALEVKKLQLSQEDNWNKAESSGRRSWSYKALRGSALGPTMALLRAQNGL